MILETTNLSKNYGPIQALDSLNLTVEKGQVLGILGPNGSGKTTTLALLLGIIHPSSGHFSWFDGNDSRPLMRVGSILETPNFYGYLSGSDNLKIVQKIKQRPGPSVSELAEMVGLNERIFSKVNTYSLGMKQRLAIAAAMVGDPDLLIFDEPTNGLDPQGIAEVRNQINYIASTGKTIVMASHILSEVEKICTHTAILQKGKLIASGPVNHILKDSNTFSLSAKSKEALMGVLKKMEGFSRATVEGEFITAHFSDFVKPEDINLFCHEQGIVLDHLAQRKTSLEDAFIELLANSAKEQNN